MSAKVKVIGVIRFSVLAKGFAVNLYGGMEKLRRYLFDDASLEFRFHIFENLCLPSLLAQSDPDFELVLLTSEELPQWARDRLDSIVGPYPNFHVYAVPVDMQHRVIRAAYESVSTEGYSHRAAFRLDNDDALAMTFVERVKKISHTLLTLHDTDEPTAISFNRGFYIHLDPNGKNTITDTIEREPLSTGTTLLSVADHGFSPYRFNHRALAQHFNLYTDISFPGFLRTVHGENEQRVNKDGIKGQYTPRRNAKAIRAHFGRDVKELEAL